jgi:hypothetical protein
VFAVPAEGSGGVLGNSGLADFGGGLGVTCVDAALAFQLGPFFCGLACQVLQVLPVLVGDVVSQVLRGRPTVIRRRRAVAAPRRARAGCSRSRWERASRCRPRRGEVRCSRSRWAQATRWGPCRCR